MPREKRGLCVRAKLGNRYTVMRSGMVCDKEKKWIRGRYARHDIKAWGLGGDFS